MDSKSVAVWCLLLGIASAEVNVTGEWIQSFGWEVTCSWRIQSTDSLLSATMFRNGNQFLVYRPGTYGQSMKKNANSQEFNMNIECGSLDAQRGRCLVTLQPLTRPSGSDIYKCDVSGERPLFREEAEEYEAFVPPTDTAVTVTYNEDSPERQALNCTSIGLPAPKLTWTVNGKKVPQKYTQYSS